MRHAPPATERVLNGVVHRERLDWETHLPGLLQRRGRGAVLRAVADGRLRVPLVTPLPVAGAIVRRAGAGAGVGALGSPMASAAADAAAAAAAAVQGVRVGGRLVVKRDADLSCRDGPFLLLEYSEQHPLLLQGYGMASKLVVFVRATPGGDGEAPLVFDARAAEGGGGGGLTNAGAGGGVGGGLPSAASTLLGHLSPEAAAAFPQGLDAIAGVEVLSPDAPFPLLGSLEAGQAACAVVNGLYSAPVFKHAPRRGDFLLVFRQDRVPGAAAAAAAAAAGVGAGGAGSGGALLAAAAAAGRTRMLAFLRPLEHVLVAGQVEPRQPVFLPGVRSAKKVGVMNPDPDTARFLRTYFCYALLVMFARVDDWVARHGQEGLAPSGPHSSGGGGGGGKGHARPLGAVSDASPTSAHGGSGVRPGALSFVEVAARLQRAFGRGALRSFASYISEVAEVDVGRGLILRKPDTPAPEDYREAVELSAEGVCLYESMAEGEALLRQAGLTSLLTEDKAVEEALRRLQGMHDTLLERLKRASAVAAAAAAAGSGGTGGGESLLWQHDGGYRRLHRTLEIAQAVYYLLQSMPWSLTRK
jgi:hypothetical protein